MDKTQLGPDPLLFPTPAVLVGAMVDGRANFMTAAWCGVACSKPPAISVSLRKQRHTFKGIMENRTFSINIPSADMAKITDYCGIYSGKKDDKSNLFDLYYGKLESAPLISNCPVNHECGLMHTLDLGAHVLMVGEIKQTHVSTHCLTDNKPDPVKIDPLVYSSGAMVYQRLGEVIGRAFSMGKKA